MHLRVPKIDKMCKGNSNFNNLSTWFYQKAILRRFVSPKRQVQLLKMSFEVWTKLDKGERNSKYFEIQSWMYVISFRNSIFLSVYSIWVFEWSNFKEAEYLQEK